MSKTQCTLGHCIYLSLEDKVPYELWSWWSAWGSNLDVKMLWYCTLQIGAVQSLPSRWVGHSRWFIQSKKKTGGGLGDDSTWRWQQKAYHLDWIESQPSNQEKTYLHFAGPCWCICLGIDWHVRHRSGGMMHRLSINPKPKLVKKKKWSFISERQKVIAEEVDKLLDAGFIQKINYPS